MQNKLPHKITIFLTFAIQRVRLARHIIGTHIEPCYKAFQSCALGCFITLLSITSHAEIQAYYYDQNGQSGNYFAGTEVIQVDANIDFNWWIFGPVTGFGWDHYSVRWVGEIEIPNSGTYTFTTRSDDGVRLWIDSNLVVDNWTAHAATDNSGTVTGLVAGQRYPITMEYFEATGLSEISLSWSGPGISQQIVPANYLHADSTPPSVVSASAPCINNQIIVTFSEEVTAATAENLANYSATNSVVLSSASLDSSNTIVTIDFFAGTGGAFDLTVDNISDVSGNVMTSASTTTITGDASGLIGSYYDQNSTQRQYFTGNSYQRVDAVVDFDWGGQSPMTELHNNDFSIRWEGEIEVPSDGDYTFYTESDDGVRLSINNNQIINNWTDHAVTTDTSSVQSLVAGQRYPVTLEYYERGGLAEISFQWQGPGFTREVVPTSNLFYNCTTTLPDVVGEWRLDESSWAGSSNEILDNSSNALHGQAINLNGLPSTEQSTPAITGDPGTCGYGTFDGTSDGYVQISDPGTNSALDLSSSHSVSAWIYPTALPSGSNRYTFISKQGNYKFNLNSSGQIRWRWGNGSSRLLTSTGSVTLNAWNHITTTYASGQQVIYINASPSGTGTSIASLSTNNNPLNLGTDQNDHSRRFVGYIDEVKIFNGVLNASQVTTIMNETHTCPVSPVDHYSLSHSGSGVTCEGENVIVSAHDSSHGSVDVAGRSIRISATSSSSGWSASDASWTLVSGNGTFSAPSTGVAEYTFSNAETSVTLALANISEADIDIDVLDLTNNLYTDDEGSSEDSILSFSNTGLRFYNDADNDGDADGTDPIASSTIAGRSSTPFVLRAVETNTETGACEARLVGAQNVELAYECVNPTSCINNTDMQISTDPIEENDLGTVNDYTSLSLTFDAEGEVPLTFTYFDVGNVRLHAQMTIAASGDDPAITLTGSSGISTSIPDDLIVSEVRTSGGGANPGTTTSGSGFTSAGSVFSVDVQAVNAQDRLTPNFGLEISPEGITLNTASLVMPVGGNLAALASPSAFSLSATLGQYTNNSISWPEVGTLTVYASISDGDYLGAGDITGTTSGNIGRFYPAHFHLNSHSITAGCSAGGFTYMSDQLFTNRNMDVNYTILARNTASSTAQNYDTALGYPVESFDVVAENNDSGSNLASRVLFPSGLWVSGQMSVSGSDNGGFARALSGSNEITDGPYASLQLGLQSSGSSPDGTDFLSSSFNMDAASSGDCAISGSCDAVMIGSSQNLLFGRLFGLNAHGPETTALSVTLKIQSWNGSEFIDNTSDSCSTIDASDILFDGSAISTDANRTVSLGSGSTTGSFSSLTPGIQVTLNSGDAGLNFSAPGINNGGEFLIDIDLSNTPWLRSDWNQDGNHSDENSLPSLEINFGRYRGHDRVIYWREIF